VAYALHTRFTLEGTWVDAPSEIWSFGFALQNDTGTAAVADLTALVGNAQAAEAAWFGTAANLMPTNGRLLRLRAANYDTAGKVTGDSAVWNYATTVVGAGGSTSVPAFCAIAVTLQSGVTSAAGRYNRCYPPFVTLSVTNEFQISATQAAGCATAVAKLINIVTSNGVAATPVVISGVNGAHQPVLTCSADTVWDTQRRRKNAIVGTRQASTVAVMT